MSQNLKKSPDSSAIIDGLCQLLWLLKTQITEKLYLKGDIFDSLGKNRLFSTLYRIMTSLIFYLNLS